MCGRASSAVGRELQLRLVIAEKRSVALAIAQALGGVCQGDGFMSAGGALVSWA